MDSYCDAVARLPIDRRGPARGPIFLAPKPVTLERAHISEGVLREGYAVTDKADGERALLWVAPGREAHLINNTLVGTPLGPTALEPGTLLDGELVRAAQRTDGGTDDLFLVFDVYLAGDQNVMMKPLPERSEVVRDLLAATPRVGPLEVMIKRHVVADGAELFAACAELLATPKPYAIDGLVFTPAHTCVFGWYAGRPTRVPEGMRWDKLFKWKPPEQNTIDFLVRDNGCKDGLRALGLHTGYNAHRWEPLGVARGVRIRYDRAFARAWFEEDRRYDPRAFEPCPEAHLPPCGPNGAAVTLEGEAITADSVVEFAYRPECADMPPEQRWVPLRIRHDKNRLYQATGSISRVANDLSVALSVWKSIHEPVTTAMITGAEDPPEPENTATGDVYYASAVPRNNMVSAPMFNFHNHHVLSRLYERCTQRGALLELCCGMGGDMPRWRDAHTPRESRRPFRFVLGVDICADNITNPSRGAYARMVRQRTAVEVAGGRTEHPDVVFAVGDCKRRLADGSAAEGLDEESAELLHILFGRIPAASPHLRFVAGRAARGFDAVSCQFAIHYFFGAARDLDGLLGNVAENLRRGGLFVTTLMSGAAVQALLAGAGGEEVRGEMDGVLAWAIRGPVTPGGPDGFGREVGVFLEKTGRLHKEFLVDPTVLCTAAARHGLALVEMGSFADTPGTHALHEALRTFTALNRWAVFRKERPRA